MQRQWADPVWAAKQRKRIRAAKAAKKAGGAPAVAAPEPTTARTLKVRVLRPNGSGLIVEQHELKTWGDFVDMLTEQYHQTPLDEVLIRIR